MAIYIGSLMSPNIKEVLFRYWGTNDFRTGQEEAVTAALDKRDSLVVLPTGGGKSLCYQLPALIMPGVCVVISPLIALMSDQVEGLQKKGIRAMHVSGPMREDELINKLDNCKFGNFKFLYLSPERAQHPLVQEHLAQMQLSLLAIDEAHCISEWGHDFRPTYREIISLKNRLPDIPIMAVTATATQSVREDICASLQLKTPTKIIGSFDRPNISIEVTHTSNKLEAIAQALEPKGTPAIVYVGTRKSAELLCGHLEKMGHKAAYFHGGSTDKNLRLAQWMSEKKPVMVATTAFGMGIDKANVQRVVHATLPYSIEQYYQEIGRCGRDGSASKATLLVEQDDDKKLWDRLMASIRPKETLQKTYKHICHYFDIAYGERPQEFLEFNLNQFCSRYNLRPKTTYHVLKLLERGQVLSLTQYDSPRTSLQLLSTQSDVYEDFVQYLLRHIGGITERFQHIHLEDISKRYGMTLEECIQIIETMEQNGTALVAQLHVDSAIEFLVPREDKRTLFPVLQQLDAYKTEKKRLSDLVWDFCTTPQCYRAKLLRYFGEHPKKSCASCSNCVSETIDIHDIVKKIKALLTKEETLSLEELISKTNLARKNLIEALTFMIHEELIEENSPNTFKQL